MADDKHGSIQRRAYEIWEREGRPDGAHERHWREAENEVAAASTAKAKLTKRQAAGPVVKPAKTVRSVKPSKAAKPKTATTKKG